MADYDWFDDRCSCDTYSGHGHLLTCQKVLGWEKNKELYDLGYGGYERKIYCRRDGLYVADVKIHEEWHENQKIVAEGARWGDMNRPIGGY